MCNEGWTCIGLMGIGLIAVIRIRMTAHMFEQGLGQLGSRRGGFNARAWHRGVMPDFATQVFRLLMIIVMSSVPLLFILLL
jgi:hypothetical protein